MDWVCSSEKGVFILFSKKRGLGTSPRILNKKRSRSEDLAFLFKIWDVGLHILILPDKKGLKNQKKSIRETVPSFLRELIVSTFSVPVNFSVSPTRDTHAKRRKCVDFLRDSIKSV